MSEPSKVYRFDIRVIGNGYILAYWTDLRSAAPREATEMFHSTIQETVEHIERFLENIGLPEHYTHPPPDDEKGGD